MLFLKSPLHCLRKTALFKVLLQSILNRPALIEIGFPFRIALRPLTHASIYLKREGIEPQIQRLIRELILALENERDKGCFYDVGANIGLYGWLVCSISSTRKTIAFEPDPQNLELLGMTQALAKLENWQVNGIALSDKCGNFSFFQDSITSATGTLSLDDKPWIEKYLGCKTQTIEVKTSTMDQILDSAQWPSLIKIDVEGHEYECLKGLFNTPLNSNIHLIQLEHHNDDMYENSISFNQINDILNENNFELIERLNHAFGDFEDLLYKNKML